MDAAADVDTLVMGGTTAVEVEGAAPEAEALAEGVADAGGAVALADAVFEAVFEADDAADPPAEVDWAVSGIEV